MPQPVQEPTSVQAVKDHLGIKDATDDAAIGRAVAATCVQVRRLPAALLVEEPAEPPAEGESPWPADIVEGSTMMAARYFRRRKSPGGVEGFTDSFAIYVSRNDPDASRLLGMGQFGPVVLG